MQMISSRMGTTLLSLVLPSLALLGAAAPALASTINYNYSETSAGTAGPGGGSVLGVPGTYGYNNSFVGGAGSTLIPTTSFGFYDDYVFIITGASADSISSTISLAGPSGTLAINNLNERIYSTTGQPVLPALGAVAGEIDSTTVFSNGLASVVQISPTVLNPGTYVLEVRGTATAAGGTYSGNLNLQPLANAPVPLPAALPLLLSGLAGLGLRARRRTR